MNKFILIIFIFSLLFCVSGCFTVENTVKGVAYGTAAVAEGVVKDTAGFFYMIDKADSWFKENYW